MAEVLIVWQSESGEEGEEPWASVDAFRVWAVGAGWRGSYRVYELDADGDWVPVLRGRLAPGDGAAW